MIRVSCLKRNNQAICSPLCPFKLILRRFVNLSSASWFWLQSISDQHRNNFLFCCNLGLLYRCFYFSKISSKRSCSPNAEAEIFVIAFDNANAGIHSKLVILLCCTSTAAKPIRSKPESKQHSLAHDRVGSSGSNRSYLISILILFIILFKHILYGRNIILFTSHFTTNQNATQINNKIYYLFLKKSKIIEKINDVHFNDTNATN